MEENKFWLMMKDCWLLIIDDWWLIVDCLHTDNTEGYGCPQADEGGERKLKRINRELKEMGPQADGGGNKFWLMMNDEWLMMLFTRRIRITPKSGRANL